MPVKALETKTEACKMALEENFKDTIKGKMQNVRVIKVQI